MADRGDTHYFGPTLHKWFFFSSGLLLLSVVWMVIDDWNAPWKKFQREFRDIDAQLARRQLEEASMQQASDMERALQAQLELAEEALDDHAEEIAAAEAVVDEKREARRVADELAKTVKQGYNWDKYLFEEHKMHGEQGLEDDERAVARTVEGFGVQFLEPHVRASSPKVVGDAGCWQDENAYVRNKRSAAYDRTSSLCSNQ